MSKNRPVNNSAIILEAFIRTTGKNQDSDDLIHWHGSQLTKRKTTIYICIFHQAFTVTTKPFKDNEKFN